jgi:monofunctional biosynthetic peptidoglycan transglycosylase
VNPPVTPLMLLRQVEAPRSVSRAYEWMSIERIPRDFLKFVLVAEDQRFFQHHGFDWQEIEVARKQAARNHEPARGASTISMQCARSLFLWQGRSWIRKALEAYYTFWLELLLPKHRILELYANVIEMGDGVYGIAAAANHHYRRAASSLSRDQLATLAALLPNPRRWDPRSPDRELLRRKLKILRQEPALHFPLHSRS